MPYFMLAPSHAARSSSASSRRDVSPQAPSSRRCSAFRVVHGLGAADDAGRRRAAAGRSSRTRASPSGRTSRGGSGSPRAPRRGRGRRRGGRKARAGRRGSGTGPSVAVGVCDQRAAARAARPACGGAVSSSMPLRLGPGDRLDLRVPALGEIPEPLPGAAAGDGDLAALARGPSASAPSSARPTSGCASRCVPGVVLDLAREQRAAQLELAQDVAAVGGVLLQEGGDPRSRAFFSRSGGASRATSSGRSSIG